MTKFLRTLLQPISKSQKSYLSLTVAVFYVTSVVNCLVSISIPLRAVVPPKGSWKLHDQPLAQGSKHHDPTLLPRPHYTFWPVPKGIRDIHGFWIPHSGFRIRRAWFWILFQWRLDSGFQSQAGFLEPYSGLQSPEFWIPRHKFPRFRITWAKISRILESGFPYRGRSQTPLYGHLIITDSSLCLWEEKALTFSPDGHFLWSPQSVLTGSTKTLFSPNLKNR